MELIETESGLEPVGTAISNYLMPLIRYKTGDTILLNDEICQCGRPFRSVKEILGRNLDYLITPEGLQIATAICSLILKEVNNIVETQFYQDKIGEVIINLVVTDEFNQIDAALLVKNTLEHTSPNMKIEIKVVKNIPRGPNNKFKSVINKIEQAQQELIQYV